MTPTPPTPTVLDALRAEAIHAGGSDGTSSPPASMSGSASLVEIKEGETLVVESAAEEGEEEDEGALEEGDALLSESGLFPPPAVAATEEGGAVEVATKSSATGDSPLTKILEGLAALSKTEQEVIQENLERVGQYPRELPLSVPWTMFFSDTASSTKASSHGATQEQYTESQTPLFTVSSVPALCGSLKAYKRLVRSKRARPGPDTMGLANFRAGQNLHFFVKGISPTWEDPMNEKGGRLTISPPLAVFDACFERVVLLLAGSSLEARASELLNPAGTTQFAAEGLITGVVASRRARGDRIELWLGGQKKRETPPGDWVDKVKEALSVELEMPDLKNGKYKRHF